MKVSIASENGDVTSPTDCLRQCVEEKENPFELKKLKFFLVFFYTVVEV